ncbi:efflux RND transporter periplasmic adaptor subunit [Thermacetogenium phaeum]|uniref:efflux RND transporter periplasmic adaptor subunit n=1 Tax=Thermacetogenium phaeum TaxID=85874 RepID=UPI001F00678C|nr:efflux RND transporter periplasmic adaptor subunit [Thermacetogenium phaeum]
MIGSLGVKNVVQLKGNKRLWALVIVIVLAVVSTILWLLQQSKSEKETVRYEQTRVKRGDILVGFDSDGSIEFSKVNLRFNVSGTISEILVTEGDKVKKGDPIARLDSQDYQNQYQLALANLQKAQEDKTKSLLDYELKIKNLENELQQLKDEYQEMEALPEAYSANEVKIKKAEIETKELEYQKLLKEYEMLKNQESSEYELQVKMARDNLGNTILYAPVSGVVLDLSKKVGERITEDQDFVTIHENNKVQATTDVIEYDISQIEVGQKVYVTVEALPDQKFVGRVSKINFLASDDSSGLVNYSVVVDIENPSPELKDGMTCVITFVRKEVQNCLIVPYEAVKMVNGKQVVLVVDENGQMSEREIKTGFTDGNSVEVLEGLKEGEIVAYPKRG